MITVDRGREDGSHEKGKDGMGSTFQREGTLGRCVAGAKYITVTSNKRIKRMPARPAGDSRFQKRGRRDRMNGTPWVRALTARVLATRKEKESESDSKRNKITLHRSGKGGQNKISMRLGA